MMEWAKKTLIVGEMFKSIQGESTLAGELTFFLRLQGCSLRCPWCDTKYSWDVKKGREMSLGDITTEMLAAGLTGFVCITGGEPLLQPNVAGLIDVLEGDGQIVSVETNGMELLKGFNPRKFVLDWKCPSSFTSEKQREKYESIMVINMNRIKERQKEPTHDEIKFVIANRDDYLYARERVEWLAQKLGRHQQMNVNIPTILFSPVVITRGSLIVKSLAEWMIADSWPEFFQPRYQLQIHKYVWKPRTRGV